LSLFGVAVHHCSWFESLLTWFFLKRILSEILVWHFFQSAGYPDTSSASFPMSIMLHIKDLVHAAAAILASTGWYDSFSAPEVKHRGKMWFGVFLQSFQEGILPAQQILQELSVSRSKIQPGTWTLIFW
jgi:uncharacterized membrane protein